MYAETLATQASQQGSLGTRTAAVGSGTGMSGSSSNGMMLRATQRGTLAFSQTQAASVQQNGRDKLSSSAPETLIVNGVSSQQPIRVGSLVAGRRFTRESQTAESQKAYFSKVAERDKIRRRLLEVDRKEATKRDVQLMRKYRKGDLPDVQIAYADLIQPLMNLAQLSPEFARLLLRDLVGGILQVSSDAF
jgi:hypothetical protein